MSVVDARHRKARPDTREYANVKAAMVNAAIELMAADGFRKFRFERLAETVACNRATIYRYFDSKQELTEAVMMALMQEITSDVMHSSAGNQVTRERFTEVLYEIITKLRIQARYAIIMDAQNVATFARLCRQYFSEITTSSLDKYLVGAPSGSILKPEINLIEAAEWLMHQITSYGFLGIPGRSAEEQKAHLNKMVVSVILK